MPILGGEKWACQSCIKGHRVSGCTHIDRELTHINPKGRPVKQCEHCRGARKAKSHHARCDCGDKKDREKSVRSRGNSASAADAGCCCYKGTKCICGQKKEPMTLKLDTSFPKSHAVPRPTKPRLTSAHSESTLTVFANGHHKPCHRLNNTAHTSGAPYKIPRPHTLHGSSNPLNSPPGLFEEYSNLPAQRSVDDFSSRDAPLPSFPESVESFPFEAFGYPSESEPKADTPSFFDHSQQPASAIGSNHSSPSESQTTDPFNMSQWPWHSSMNQSGSQFGMDSLSTSPTTDYNSLADSDWALPSAGLKPFWSATDLPLDPNKLSQTVTPPSIPGLTSGSSVAQSEAGEPARVTEPEGVHSQQSMGDQSFWDQTLNIRPAEHAHAHYRLSSTPKRAEFRQPPTSVPVNTTPGSFDQHQPTHPVDPFYHSSTPKMNAGSPFSAGPNESTTMATTGLSFPMSQNTFKPDYYSALDEPPRPITMPSSPTASYTEAPLWPQTSHGDTVDFPTYDDSNFSASAQGYNWLG